MCNPVYGTVEYIKYLLLLGKCNTEPIADLYPLDQSLEAKQNEY